MNKNIHIDPLDLEELRRVDRVMPSDYHYDYLVLYVDRKKRKTIRYCKAKLTHDEVRRDYLDLVKLKELLMFNIMFIDDHYIGLQDLYNGRKYIKFDIDDQNSLRELINFKIKVDEANNEIWNTST